MYSSIFNCYLRQFESVETSTHQEQTLSFVFLIGYGCQITQRSFDAVSVICGIQNRYGVLRSQLAVGLRDVLFSSAGVMANENNCDIPKLQGGDDYHAWKFSMRMFLLGRDLWEIVEGSETIEEYATEMEKRKYKRRENHALSKICLSIAPSLHIYVRSCNTAKEAWDNLEKRFEEKSLTRKIEYRRKLYAVKFSNGMDMIEHVNDLKTIAERLESLGDPVSEKDLLMILISSLSDTYNNLITTLETVKEEELSWEYVRDRVISEYERRQHKEKEDRHPHDALYVGKGVTRYEQGREQVHANGRHDQDKDNIECFYCKKFGHYKSECPKLEKKNVANFVKEVDRLSIADEDGGFYPEFALHTEEVTRGENRWIVDSGCSKHMSFVKSDFVYYKEFAMPLDVRLADKSLVKAVGFGSVQIYLSEEKGREVPIEIEKVLFVPELQKRLISISQIAGKGGEVTFKKKICVLSYQKRTFPFGQRIGNLYELSCQHAVHLKKESVTCDKIEKEC